MTRASDLAKLLGAGATILDGTTISTADNTEQLTLISTDADANQGPVLRLRRDSASPADNDIVGYLVYSSDNDAGEITDFGGIRCHIDDASDGTEDGNLKFFTNKAGTEVSRMGLASGETVFNEDSVDVDFRVESNGNTHGIYLDAGAGLVGIGNSNPDGHYNLADDLVIGNGSGGRGLTIYSGNDSSGYVGFNDAEQDSMTAYIQYGHNDNTMTLASSAGASLKIDSIGAVTKPLQPAFLVGMSSNSAQFGNGAFTPTLDTEIFDQNADFSSNTFTAPVTGRYQLSWLVYAGNLDTSAAYYYLKLATSNREYTKYLYTHSFDADVAYYGWGTSILADMDVNDTATFQIGQVNGHSTTVVYASNTYASGALIC